MALDSQYTLNNVASMSNYGLYVTGNTTDPVFSRGIINSKPNLLIAGSTLTIDYSHVYDTSDSLFLKRTFGSLTAGNTFNFVLSEYYDELNNLNLDIGGGCTFSYTLNDSKIIIATAINGFTAQSDYDYYSKDNFVDIPSYNFYPAGSTIGYYLVNSLPNLSTTTFKEMGFLGSGFAFEDYVEIIGGTAENYGRIPVYGTVTLKDNQEILYFESGGTAQSLIDSFTQVNLYLRGYPSLLIAPVTTIVPGILTVTDVATNKLVNCFENQSLNEYNLRKYRMPTTQFASFVNCESCFDLIYGESVGTAFSTVLTPFNNLIFLQVYSNTYVITTTAINTTFSYTTTPNPVVIPDSITTVLKVDLSHPTLAGYDLFVYGDPSRLVSVGTKYAQFGKPGYNGAYAMLTNYTVNSTLYCTLVGPTTIYFQINT